MTRERRYIFPVRTRVDAATAKALQAQVEAGVELGSVVRLLIESGVGRLHQLSPVRRTRTPIANPETFAAAVAHLGSIAGNLQRFYTLMREEHRIDDAELAALKDEIRRTARQVREAIGGFDDA